MIKLGTIGTSNICEKFIQSLYKNQELSLSAVYSRSPETGRLFADKFSCDSVFCDLEQMAKSKKIEAVYIASPNSCHYYQSKLFLENGKHVICEKPICENAQQYAQLKELADKKGLIYMEAIKSIHTEHYKKVKDAFSKIGKPVMARFDFSQRSSRLDLFLKGEQVNIFDMSLKAGTLMDLGVYCVFAAADFLGAPKSISATASYLKGGADGSGTAVFSYDDCTAVLTYCKTAQGNMGSEIIGTDGVLKISSVSQYTGVSLVKDGEETLIVPTLSFEEVMSGEAHSFARYITDPLNSVDEYKRASELSLLVHNCMDQIKIKAGIKYPEK